MRFHCFVFVDLIVLRTKLKLGPKIRLRVCFAVARRYDKLAFSF